MRARTPAIVPCGLLTPPDYRCAADPVRIVCRQRIAVISHRTFGYSWLPASRLVAVRLLC